MFVFQSMSVSQDKINPNNVSFLANKNFKIFVMDKTGKPIYDNSVTLTGYYGDFSDSRTRKLNISSNGKAVPRCGNVNVTVSLPENNGGKTLAVFNCETGDIIGREDLHMRLNDKGVPVEIKTPVSSGVPAPFASRAPEEASTSAWSIYVPPGETKKVRVYVITNDNRSVAGESLLIDGASNSPLFKKKGVFIARNPPLSKKKGVLITLSGGDYGATRTIDLESGNPDYSVHAFIDGAEVGVSKQQGFFSMSVRPKADGTLEIGRVLNRPSSVKPATPDYSHVPADSQLYESTLDHISSFLYGKKYAQLDNVQSVVIREGEYFALKYMKANGLLDTDAHISNENGHMVVDKADNDLAAQSELFSKLSALFAILGNPNATKICNTVFKNIATGTFEAKAASALTSMGGLNAAGTLKMFDGVKLPFYTSIGNSVRKEMSNKEKTRWTTLMQNIGTEKWGSPATPVGAPTPATAPNPFYQGITPEMAKVRAIQLYAKTAGLELDLTGLTPDQQDKVVTRLDQLLNDSITGSKLIAKLNTLSDAKARTTALIGDVLPPLSEIEIGSALADFISAKKSNHQNFNSLSQQEQYDCLRLLVTVSPSSKMSLYEYAGIKPTINTDAVVNAIKEKTGASTVSSSDYSRAVWSEIASTTYRTAIEEGQLDTPVYIYKKGTSDEKMITAGDILQATAFVKMPPQPVQNNVAKSDTDFLTDKVMLAHNLLAGKATVTNGKIKTQNVVNSGVALLLTDVSSIPTPVLQVLESNSDLLMAVWSKYEAKRVNPGDTPKIVSFKTAYTEVQATQGFKSNPTWADQTSTPSAPNSNTTGVTAREGDLT